MIKSGLQNEAFIQRIKESGSLALKGKNDRGVNIFSGSVTDDGVISGRLIRPKYNIDELKEAVDLEISELLPQNEPSQGSFVTRSLYEELQIENRSNVRTIESQSAEINSLTSKVEELHAVTQSLNIQLDGLDITNESVDSQLNTTQQQFSQVNTDLQIALQTSTQESIERVSLTARNASLKQEIDLLREQLFGKQSQLSAGAESSGTLFTVNSSPTREPNDPPIRGSKQRTGNIFNRLYRDTEWVNGPTITIFNATDENLTISISLEGESEWIQSVGNKEVEGGKSISFELELNQTAYSIPTDTGDKKGAMIFTATSSDGTEESVTLQTKLVRWS